MQFQPFQAIQQVQKDLDDNLSTLRDHALSQMQRVRSHGSKLREAAIASTPSRSSLSDLSRALPYSQSSASTLMGTVSSSSRESAAAFGSVPFRRVQSETTLDSSATAPSSLSCDREESASNIAQAQSLLEGDSMDPVEEFAGRLARTSRKAISCAQMSLENAQSNWSTLIQRHRSSLDAGPAPKVQIVGNPLSSHLSMIPAWLGHHQSDAKFGALWQVGRPAIEALQSKARALHQHDPSTSCLRTPGRHVTIVTTASLPWMTGTSINPLLRAHFLAAGDAQRAVTLVVPWLSLPDQQVVYPNNVTFKTPEEQERHVRDWVEKRTGESSARFRVSFYPGRYAPEKGSILPVGDITEYIPAHEADIAVLEEPEHLTWYHHGRRWTRHFKHVVGIMHTNYLDYARREEGGAVKAALLRGINSLCCRVHCHKVIKLSDAVQDLPRQCIQFVHGVSPKFLEVGAAKARAAAAAAHRNVAAAEGSLLRGGASSSAGAALSAPLAGPDSGEGVDAPVWRNGAYFLGKMVWAKGYSELLELLEYHKGKGTEAMVLDVYGHGDDKKVIEERARTSGLPLTFHGATDHADEAIQDYKVFVNPSLSDVVATTTAEALAMGKFVVCAKHPSNAFFSSFPNCMIYSDADEFAEKLSYALAHEPAPMSDADLRRLSWADATERFLDAAELAPHERAGPLERALDSVAWRVHNGFNGVEALRINAGAGANTRATPQRVTDYTASASDVGGWLDDRTRCSKVRQRGG